MPRSPACGPCLPGWKPQRFEVRLFQVAVEGDPFTKEGCQARSGRPETGSRQAAAQRAFAARNDSRLRKQSGPARDEILRPQKVGEKPAARGRSLWMWLAPRKPDAASGFTPLARERGFVLSIRNSRGQTIRKAVSTHSKPLS